MKLRVLHALLALLILAGFASMACGQWVYLNLPVAGRAVILAIPMLGPTARLSLARPAAIWKRGPPQNAGATATNGKCCRIGWISGQSIPHREKEPWRIGSPHSATS